MIWYIVLYNPDMIPRTKECARVRVCVRVCMCVRAYARACVRASCIFYLKLHTLFNVNVSGCVVKTYPSIDPIVAPPI